MSTKLTSHVLQFQDPTFSEGVQITVRDGPKWAKRVTPGMLVDVGAIPDDGFYEDLREAEAEVVGVLSTTFGNLPEEILERHQDPSCRDYNKLLTKMERIYPGFKATNVVSVLFFRVVSDSE